MTLRRQRGQTGTELMAIISVVVIGVSAASYAFVPEFRSGVHSLARDVRSILRTGQIGGQGLPRNGGVAAPAALPGAAPFTLPQDRRSGCGAGMVCNPPVRNQMLGAPVTVCTGRGDNC